MAERGDGWRLPMPSWEELEGGGASLEGLGEAEREMIAGGRPWFRELGGPEWELLALPTGHWPMFSKPRELADLLASLAPHAR